MENSLYFVISSVILSFTLLASFYLRYRIPTKDNRILMLLMWIVVISNLLDLGLGLNGIWYRLPTRAIYLLNTVYLITRQFIIVGYAGYIVLCTDSGKLVSKGWKIICAITNLYGLFLIFGNIRFHWLFLTDVQGNYVRGQQIWLYYIFAICYIVFAIWHLIRYGHALDWSRKIALLVFVMIPALGAFLQYAFPGFNIESFTLTIGMLWVYLNVPKTNRMLDSDTSALNQYAFSCKMESLTEQKVKGHLVVIRFRDKSAIQDRYGLESYKKLMREVTYELCSLQGRDRVYYLRDARFAVILDGADTDKAYDIAKNLMNKVQKQWKIYGNEITVWGVGAFLSIPDDVRNINDIYSYLAYLEIMPSLHGGSMYEGGHLDVAYMKRYGEIERAIERALQKTSFEVYYQPIYGVKEQKIIAAEALLRMYDEEMGFISPEEFIPIAEKNGKIIEIGQMVLESVCRFLQKEDITKYGLHYIEVNLSVIECMQDILPEEIKKTLEKYEVAPQLLNLEITETALVQSKAILADNMRKISEMGVSFSLDDYGTGYSTITYMMTLPFRIVKIDKSILWSSFENERAMIALCASINMIKEMNMEIVVEGVESREMAQKLTQLGCDYLQGYYFSKPLPVNKFIECISKNPIFLFDKE